MFWRKRKQKNRRMGRVQVLDVKVRSSVAAAARTRFIATMLGIVFGVVAGLYALWCGGAWALDQLVYQNKSFAIQQVEIETDGVISAEQLRRWSKVRTGQNLLALDLAQVKRDLELVPSVKAVALERILPSTLRIRVTEREPIAQVNVPRPKDDQLEFSVFHIDSEGCVILPLDPRQRSIPLHGGDDELPLLSGINFSELQPGRKIDSAQINAALKLIQDFQSSSMANLVDLKRIDVSSVPVLIATTAQGSEITFGLNDFERQLNRWYQVHQECARYSRSIASLDLAVSENTPLRLQEASVLPPPAPAPKAIKPSRNKRKHV